MARKTRLPYLQLYTQDIRGEQTLLRCSFEARYVWREMLGFMHESPERGYLMHANGDPMTEQDLTQMIAPDPHYAGSALDRMRNCILELEMNGVFSRDRRKIIYNRRMVRDEKKAETARSNGKKGGNPKLKTEDNSEINGSKNGDKSDLGQPATHDEQREIQPSDKGRDKLRVQRPESRDHVIDDKSSTTTPPAQPANVVVAVGDRISEITGWDKDPRWFGDYSRLRFWLDEGWDVELDIIPTVRLMMAKRKTPPQTLQYFERAIADANAQRLTPVPKGNPDEHRPVSRTTRASASLDRALAELEEEPG